MVLHKDFLLHFEVLPGQTKDSFVYSLAGSLIKIMVSTGEPERLPTVAMIELLSRQQQTGAG